MTAPMRPPTSETATRFALPEERAVALVFNGSTAGVMMATPKDLPDFLRGFALSEGIITRATDLHEIEVIEHADGFEVRGQIPPDRAQALDARRRLSVGPVGCGLCGIDSLAAAAQRPPAAPNGRGTVIAAGPAVLNALEAAQQDHGLIGGMHAAAYFTESGLIALRGDVGRHNALDKVLGAVAGGDLAQGGILMTSRLSVDLVQKCLRAGVPVLISVSRPTTAAVALAQAANMTMIVLTKGGPITFAQGKLQPSGEANS